MSELKEQLQLYTEEAGVTLYSPKADKVGSNSLEDKDKPFHQWYRFVLSFPPHLVRGYFDEFAIEPGMKVLDPFCGTGTTLVEAKLRGLIGIGFEPNPFPNFASSVKLDWSIDVDELLRAANIVADRTQTALGLQGIDEWQPNQTSPNIHLRQLAPEIEKLLITNSISPLPLHKTFVLLDHLKTKSVNRSYNHLLLALGNALVTQISNLRFGPEVGVGKFKRDALVVSSWLAEVRKIANDLQSVEGKSFCHSQVHLADARNIPNLLEPHSIDTVITSPPYPNEKDYTRTTRLESVLLEFYTTKAELQTLKKNLLRSNTMVGPVVKTKK
jgi:hypothetical protein